MSTVEGPVLLLAETGFIIRNLVLGTFAEAAMQRRPLVVAVPDPKDAGLLNIAKGKPLTLIPFPREPRGRLLSRRHRWLQLFMYRFKEAQKANKSLEIQTRLYESNQTPIDKAMARLLIGIGHLLNYTGMMGPVEDRYLSAIARWPITNQWREVLEFWRPSAIVSTMLTHAALHRASSDLPVVMAACQLGIPCGTLIQSWDNLSSKTAILPPWLDRFWTWSETMSGELLTLNPRISSARVKVVGSPQFDFHLQPDLIEPRDVFMRRVGLNPSLPYVLIGTGTKVWLPDEPNTVVLLIQALRKSIQKCSVLIRLHPKDDGSRWTRFREQLEALGVVLRKTSPSVHMDRSKCLMKLPYD